MIRASAPGAFGCRPAMRLVAATAVALCLGAKAPVRSQEAGVKVQSPWLRFIMPSLPAAGYFTLSNDSTKAHVLVGATSPDCGSIMLHQSVDDHGMERMIMVRRLRIPAHGHTSFAPGSYHLMCMSPAASMKPGRSVSVTLLFADGGTLTVPFPVRNAQGK
ncbi:MAG: copper chaperone PCu(A)C [Cyanobacteria bacterium REEB65]|nr:copper chaperone PCu(A)C [Cyanobacteria bacterium REEB65]